MFLQQKKGATQKEKWTGDNTATELDTEDNVYNEQFMEDYFVAEEKFNSYWDETNTMGIEEEEYGYGLE